MLTQRTVLVASLILAACARSIGADPAADAGPQPARYVLVHEHRHYHRSGLLATAVTADESWLHGIAFDGSVKYFKFKPGDVLPYSSGSIGNRQFQGFSNIAASNDGRYFVCTSPRGRRAVVFRRNSKRDHETIMLGPTTDGLSDWMPQESIFSPDGRFLYTTDRRGWIYAFEVTAERNWTPARRDRCSKEQTAGVNSLVIHPDGLTAIALDRVNGTLTVLDRDPVAGSLGPRQVLTDDHTSLRGLSGAVDAALSADGRYLYVSCGDVRGDYGISVFQLTSRGTLQLLQEMFDGEERTRDLLLGEDLALSPDGTQLVLCSKHRDKVLSFDCNPATGRLSGKQEIYTAPQPPLGVTGPAFGPNGHLYVVTEYGKLLLVFAPRDVTKVAAAATAAPTATPPAIPRQPTPAPTVPMPMATKPPVPAAPMPTGTPIPPPQNPTATSDASRSPPPQMRLSGRPSPPVIGKSALLTGHTGRVTELAFSPDGLRLASASDDKTVRVWNVAKRELLFELKGTVGAVLTTAWSPDGMLIAAAGVDRNVILWDAATGREVRRIALEESLVHRIAFSPDSSRLLTSTEAGLVRLWNVVDGKQLRTFEHKISMVMCLGFSPDGTLALCGGQPTIDAARASGESVRVWRVANGESLMRIQTTQPLFVRKALFTPDGRKIIAYDADQRGLGAWEIATGTRVDLLQQRSFLREGDLATVDRGRAVVTRSILSLNLWICDLDSGEALLALEGAANASETIAASPDGRHVAAAGASSAIYLWQLPASMARGAGPAIQYLAVPRSEVVQELDRLTGHKARILDVAFAPDGVRAASCGDDGLLKVWDVKRRTELLSIKVADSGPYGLDWAPDGKTIAIAGAAGAVSLRDPTTGKEIRTWKAGSSHLVDVALSPDGKSLLSAATFGGVQLWNVADGKQIRTFEHQIRTILGLSFSRDGALVMAYGAPTLRSGATPMPTLTESLRVWRVADGAVQLKLTSTNHDMVTAATFSPDGMSVAADMPRPRGIGIWDLHTGERKKTIPLPPMPIGDLAFMRQGRYLLVGQSDVFLHDLALESQAIVLKGPTGPVTSIAVSPDGRTILCGAMDQTIRIWRTPEIAVPDPAALKPSVSKP